VVDLTAATEIQIGGLVGGYTGPQPDQWTAVGQPECWIASINPRQCRGDADGANQGANRFWVSNSDLDVLIAAWNKTYEQLQGQMVGGIPLICADFDHLPQGPDQFRVSTNDLDILISNWQVANAPAPNCP
jgi:hypothetical protein